MDGPTLCKIAVDPRIISVKFTMDINVYMPQLKFQNVVLPNGLIGKLNGPYEGRRHDATMLYESGLLRDLREAAWANDGRALCLYGDPAYPLGIHLQAPFRNVHITQQMERFNEHMSEVKSSCRMDVWLHFKLLQVR